MDGPGSRVSTGHDVVVVGASLAGCAAATGLARRGLSVALLEAHPDPDHAKRVCTHVVQAGAVPAFAALGWLDPVRDAGAVEAATDVWTRWGWVRPPEGAPVGLNLRRSVLDPLVRGLTATEPGVSLRLGRRVRALLRGRDGAVTGVLADGPDGPESVTGRLVVAADGRHSPVARLAGLPVRSHPHGRVTLSAYWTGVGLTSGGRAQVWQLDPDSAFAFPTDAGQTVLGVTVAAGRRPEFAPDPDAAVRRELAGLADAPDLTRAERVSDWVHVVSHPTLRRPPTAPGLALVGDAALSSDYAFGVGCGWAVQSGTWLADAVGPRLAAGEPLAPGLSAYRRRRRRELAGHALVIADAATGRRFTLPERVMLAAAARDERTAATVSAFVGRTISPQRAFGPGPVLRAVGVDLAHAWRARRRPAPGAPATAPAGARTPVGVGAEAGRGLPVAR